MKFLLEQQVKDEFDTRVVYCNSYSAACVWMEKFCGIYKVEYVLINPYKMTRPHNVEEMNISLAHEMGHLWELKYVHHGDCLAMVNAPLAEEKAWLHAVRILHNVGFSNWDHFLSIALSSLESYKDEWSADREDLIMEIAKYEKMEGALC